MKALWPATLGRHPRQVRAYSQKCYRLTCLTWTNTFYSLFATCQRHAEEDAEIERAAEKRAAQAEA